MTDHAPDSPPTTPPKLTVLPQTVQVGAGVGPEPELISALLESGTYDPPAHGIPDSAFRAFGPLHAFATDYQAHSGTAPPIDLVRRRFPGYIHTTGLSVSWAVHQMRQAELDRTLRKSLSAAAAAVRDESYTEALGVMRDTVASVSTSNSPGTVVTDFSGTRANVGVDAAPIPPGRLADITGGHVAGQMWLVAALWGVGKSFKLVHHAVAAAEAGWDVVVFSLEMSTQSFLARLRQQALRNNGDLRLLDLDTQERLMAAWADSAGVVSVYGPERGRVDAGMVASAVRHSHTLVVVDYVGRMYSSDGRSARSEWAVHALVSAELQAVAGLRQVPVLAAAQLNRTGELGGTIALEQDADLILVQSRVADGVNSVRRNELRKSRETELTPPWYSRFDPRAGDYSDLTADEAMALRMHEEAEVWG